jgi:hypothetical protein
LIVYFFFQNHSSGAERISDDDDDDEDNLLDDCGPPALPPTVDEVMSNLKDHLNSIYESYKKRRNCPPGMGFTK